MSNFNRVQVNTQRAGRPQDQLRQVRITSSSGAVVPSSGNVASNNRRYSSGSTQTLTQQSNNGVRSNLRRAFAVRKANTEPSQKSNRGTTVRTNPKVQERANGYSKPNLLWYQKPNTQQQSAVRNPLNPARTPALNGRKAASRSGPGSHDWSTGPVKATRVSHRRGSMVSRPGQTKQFGTDRNGGSIYNQPYAGRRGAAQSSSSGTWVIKTYADPIDLRYKETVNYVIPSRYGSVTIKRLKPKNRAPQRNAVPQRRDPPQRQRQPVWTQRTRS